MRYAIYFTPDQGTALASAAADWLGRDPHDGQQSAPNHAFADHVAEPARYGFHATMKAPFALRPVRAIDELILAFDRFSASRPSVDIGHLVIEQIGPFFALVPADTNEALNALAAQCVREFEPFRAFLSEDDIARRKPEKLTEEQRSMLHEWGYPYVFSEFRFHMTLTGPVTDADAPEIRAELNRRFATVLQEPVVVDGLSVFREEQRGDPFTVFHRAQLSNTKQLDTVPS